MVECDTLYHPRIVKAFYANLKPLDNGFGFVSYMGGRPIMVTMSSISEVLNLPNQPELEKIFVSHSNWPKPPEETLNEVRA
jgi:hypothetical protein